MKLWIAFTNDEYELPIFVEDSAIELSKKLGITLNSLYRSKNLKKDKTNKKYIIDVVYVDDITS